MGFRYTKTPGPLAPILLGLRELKLPAPQTRPELGADRPSLDEIDFESQEAVLEGRVRRS